MCIERSLNEDIAALRVRSAFYRRLAGMGSLNEKIIASVEAYAVELESEAVRLEAATFECLKAAARLTRAA